MIVPVYALLAGLYLVTQSKPYKGDFLVKAAPILLLAGVVIIQLSGAIRLWLIGALLFSAAGDIALALDNKRYFVIGLGLFLVAHLLYIPAFLMEWEYRPIAFIIIALVLTVAALLVRKLLPQLGSLKIPVLLYIAVIVVMVITSSLHAPLNPVLLAGTLIFMFSDATIAVNKFLTPIPARDFLVMFTYYLAQLLIVLSFLY